MGNEPKRKGCRGCLTKLIVAFVILVVLPSAALITWGVIEHRKRQEAAWQEALHVHQKLKEEADRYADFKKSEEFDFFAPYAEREKWDAKIGRAEKGIGEIESSVIDNDDLSLGQRLAEILKRIEEVKAAIGEVEQRMARLETFREETPGRIPAAELQIPITDRIIDDLQARIAEVKTDFPDRTKAIDQAVGTYTRLSQISERSKTALEAAKTERAKMETDAFVDYVRMNEGVEAVFARFNKLQGIDAKLRAKLDELYRSYSKILADMKVDYFLVIGRSTWDNDSDYNTERIYTYPPVEVSPERYAYFTKLDPTKELARLYWSDGRFRASPAVDRSHWIALGIDAGRGVSTSHDAGVFWLEDAPVKTYHKYRVTENGEVKTTDWVEVDEDDYAEMYDYLGMALVNKPYGFFEDEAIRSAAPPGMAFVGMDRYGRWADDPATGESYWEWDDEYDDAFEIDIDIGKKHRYTRSQWRKWRSDYRGKRPYYVESEAGPPIFGTHGSRVRKSSRYQESAFVAGGGLAATAASFRGAGPGRRGRGPGGFGK
jgi:hypothetical protein